MVQVEYTRKQTDDLTYTFILALRSTILSAEVNKPKLLHVIGLVAKTEFGQNIFSLISQEDCCQNVNLFNNLPSNVHTLT